MYLLYYRGAVHVVENEIKRIPAILKEIPASQITDMRRQVLTVQVVEGREDNSLSVLVVLSFRGRCSGPVDLL